MVDLVERDSLSPAVLPAPGRIETMKIQSPETKDKLIQRLKRVEGQVRGVQTMLEDERDCRDIMQQLAAIHSAVQAASRIFLQDYAMTCLMEMDQDSPPLIQAEIHTKRQKMVQDMISLLDKAV
jgi:CsoR family transcriptional regulator, copper-sensing transcriptional repressor